MLRFIRTALLGACLLVAAAPLAHAATPSTLSYQGVLTDGGGNLLPDGPYNLTFRIWDAIAGGSALWTEAHVGVPVTKGGFSVVLGSITPINLPFDIPYYLGVQVGADPELIPRVALTSSPAAMSLWMLGDTFSPAGEASWYSSTSGLGWGGGYLHLYGRAPFNTLVNLEADFSGAGTWAYLAGAGSTALLWDGDTGGGSGHGLSGSSSMCSSRSAGNARRSRRRDARRCSTNLASPGAWNGT